MSGNPRWPADAVDRRPLAALVPSARNARTHSDDQVAQIAASIREYGFTMPVLVDEAGSIIAGHGRVLAASLLGLSEVPVVVATGWDDNRKRAYMLADNKIALNAGWNLELLKGELTDLAAIGTDLQALGFSRLELSSLMPLSGGRTDPDEIPDVPQIITTQPGDLWALGDHRLICGSCTDSAVVDRLVSGYKPNLMVTDPPYGVNYDPAWRNRAGVSASARTGVVANDDRADWREAWALFPGSVAYVWHSALHAAEVADSLTATGFSIRSQIIWAKESLVMGRGHYHWQHEPCWYAARKTATWTGDRKQSTLWSIASRGQDADTIHSTQKPVECMRRPILNNSKPGDSIYEPFSGSGTSLIAAEATGRVSLSIDLAPSYVDLAIARWFLLHPDQPVVLADGGQTYAEVAAARATRVRPPSKRRRDKNAGV